VVLGGVAPLLLRTTEAIPERSFWCTVPRMSCLTTRLYGMCGKGRERKTGWVAIDGAQDQPRPVQSRQAGAHIWANAA
jgi:hypothetical protein